MNYNEFLTRLKTFPSTDLVKFYCHKIKKYYYISKIIVDTYPYPNTIKIILTDNEFCENINFNNYRGLCWAIEATLNPFNRETKVVFHTNNPLEKFTILDS